MSQDNLKIARALIDKAIDEKERLAKLNAELDKLGDDHKDSEYWTRYDRVRYKYSPTPRKAAVNDYIKLARRLLLESYLD